MRWKKPLPSTKEIREAFDCDAEMGVLIWRPRIGKNRFVNGFNTAHAGNPTGCPNGVGYLRVLWKGRHYVAHRLIWKHVHGTEPDEIDHINGDRSDNRIANLREATPSQNMVNARNRPKNKTGFKGVYLRRDGSFQATIRRGGKGLHLGYFKTAEEASAVFQKAARIVHGEFLPKD